MSNNVSVKLKEALQKEYKYVDSSLLNGCSVRVHDNPLLSDCVVDGMLKSDLEYKLQSKDPNLVNELVMSVRNGMNNMKSSWDMPAGVRHLSMANIFGILRSHDVEDAAEDYKQAVEDAKAEQEAAASPVSPTE